MTEFYPIALPETALRRTLDTAEGTLATLEAKPTDRTGVRGIAILVPGFSGSKEDFIPLLALLVAARYQVLCYDQRGQYESAGPDDTHAYSIVSFAQDLRTVIDIVGGGHPVHLVGHSFGALVARHLVIAEPELVRSLTLLDSGPTGASLERARWLGLLTWLIRFGRTKVLAALVVHEASRAGVTPARRLWLRHRLERTRRASLIGMCKAVSREPDRVGELASTSVPVLVVFGENDDVWSPGVQKEMARQLNARAVIIKNAGHTPNEDQPEATAAALLEFWDNVDGGL